MNQYTACRLALLLAVLFPSVAAWTATIPNQSTLFLHSVAKPAATAVFPFHTMESPMTVSDAPVLASSSMELSAVTLDPATFLTDIFGGLINTPIILAVPIVAALAVSGLIAYFLVQSSVPYEDDD